MTKTLEPVEDRDLRVLRLAQEIVGLMRQHSHRPEAVEARDIAGTLFGRGPWSTSAYLGSDALLPAKTDH